MSRAAAIRKHVLDWKFLAALAFLIMGVVATWAAQEGTQANRPGQHGK